MHHPLAALGKRPMGTIEREHKVTIAKCTKRGLRVLLITPENRFIRAFRRGQLNNFAQLTMPYLAGFVANPHSVMLIDEYNQEVDFDTPCDLVGITCNTPNARHVYGMAAAFRERGCKVVLGGPHVTLLPEEAERYADAVVVGEAEETWPQVLEDASRGALQRRYRAEHPPSLNALPNPRRDLVVGRRFLGETIIATRGCPHRCTYCNLRQIYFPVVRFRPVDEIAAEVKNFRSPFFAFWDDHLCMDPACALRLFEALAGVGKRWAAMVTPASTRNERLLAAAAKAGCSCLFLGLESFSSESLEEVNKSFNRVESYGECVSRVHRHGILVQVGIVFGFDGDDATTFEKTFEEAQRIGLDGATVSILTPFPESPLFERLEREKRLLTRDWSYFNGKTAVAFEPARMTPETLWNGYMWFRRRFFSRRAIFERARRAGVRPLESMVLNWGYRRTLKNRIPGSPIPSREA